MNTSEEWTEDQATAAKLAFVCDVCSRSDLVSANATDLADGLDRDITWLAQRVASQYVMSWSTKTGTWVRANLTNPVVISVVHAHRQTIDRVYKSKVAKHGPPVVLAAAA